MSRVRAASSLSIGWVGGWKSIYSTWPPAVRALGFDNALLISPPSGRAAVGEEPAISSPPRRPHPRCNAIGYSPRRLRKAALQRIKCGLYLRPCGASSNTAPPRGPLYTLRPPLAVNCYQQPCPWRGRRHCAKACKYRDFRQ